MHLKNGKKLYNEREVTFFRETERYVNNLDVYNRSKNGTNLWDDLIIRANLKVYKEVISKSFILNSSSLLVTFRR